jgi:hypothetical protein
MRKRRFLASVGNVESKRSKSPEKRAIEVDDGTLVIWGGEVRSTTTATR